jgi:hypothetical protein
VGNRTPRYPLIVPLAIQRPQLSGFASTMRARSFTTAPLRLCLNKVREFSASLRGSALVFQGVGESHYKCLPERERENFNDAVFALAFYSRRQDRELLGAISRGFFLTSILGAILGPRNFAASVKTTTRLRFFSGNLPSKSIYRWKAR